jgi:predicted RNase H-like HicB family nuclease
MRAVRETRGELVLYWSEAERAVVAEAPELPGCTARGATYEDALANLLAAVESWREAALGTGVGLTRRPVRDSLPPAAADQSLTSWPP